MNGRVRKSRTVTTNGREHAAAYEHQRYSTENRRDVILAFTAARDLEIVKVYVDEGKSELRPEGRDQLRALLRDVASGEAEYSVILVYDVSRGRVIPGPQRKRQL